MKKNMAGDSLVGIIIGVFILSIVLLGIINVLGFNQNTLSIYNDSVNKYIVNSNVQNIIKKLDNNIINTNDFYLYKDTVNKEFKYLTGTANQSYKYVDKLLNKTDPNASIGKTYQINLKKDTDILKHVIYPPEISNIVFDYDANNIDGSNNSTLSDGDKISVWKDLSGNGLDAKETDSNKQPTYKTNIIGLLPNVVFDGTDDNFKIDQNVLINDDGDGYYNRDYREKTYAIVLKTGFDTTSDQVIFEQGGKITGYNFMIHNGDIYASIHNKANSGDYSATDHTYHYKWDDGHKFKGINLGQAYPDTIYFITIVQDSTHETSPGVPDDVNNKLKIYLNGVLVASANHVDPQAENYLIGLGAINYRNVQGRDQATIDCTECDYYLGSIGEFISWNHALTNNEIRGLQNYFKEKWLGATSNIKYHKIQSEVKKVN